jgi:hypothetical protein
MERTLQMMIGQAWTSPTTTWIKAKTSAKHQQRKSAQRST